MGKKNKRSHDRRKVSLTKFTNYYYYDQLHFCLISTFSNENEDTEDKKRNKKRQGKKEEIN